MHQITLLGLIVLAAPLGAAVTFDSSFECGNATTFVQVGPSEYSFDFELDTNSTDRQWFYFSVIGASGETLTFNLQDTDDSNVPGHWSLAHPVASADGGATWALTTGATSNTATTYTFSHLIGADPERIAFHYPHTHTRVLAQIASWETHPHVTTAVLGQSTEGRDITRLRITDTSSSPPWGKVGFWIVARQHAAEVTGSWMAEGFMEFLLSSDPQAVWLRENAVINIVPMMNPDGVIAGNYRDNARGINLNREWNAPDPTDSPEVLAVTDAIAAWVSGGDSYDFFADLHSTSGGAANYAYHAAPGVEPPLYPTPATYAADSDALLTLVASGASDFFAWTADSASTDQRLSRQRQMFQYGVLAVLFEGTYNYTSYGPSSGQYMTPDRHRAIGAALAVALQEHFETITPAGLTLLGVAP